MPKVVDIEEKRNHFNECSHEFFLEMGYNSVTTRQKKQVFQRGHFTILLITKDDLFAQRGIIYINKNEGNVRNMLMDRITALCSMMEGTTLPYASLIGSSRFFN